MREHRIIQQNSVGCLRHLFVVGGAHGVGKTSVIGLIGATTVNTGDLFDSALTRQNRDVLVDWTAIETAVSNDLVCKVLQGFERGDTVVIDTHYAVKQADGKYRIGLLPQHVRSLAARVCTSAEISDRGLSVSIVLLTCDAGTLLGRRLGDPSRARSSDMRDCEEDLLNNALCAKEYMLAVKEGVSDSHLRETHTVKFIAIDNESVGDTERALREMLSCRVHS